jgi:ABC-type amino acid transport substrate-binding protein
MRALLAILLVLPLLGQSPVPVELSASERQYVQRLGKVTMCVDPDWAPFESVDQKGRYEGIAADLIALVSERSGIPLELVPTRNWDESLARSRKGECLVLPFLNKTPEREGWLAFTEPIFSDPNVFITREEHSYIGDPAELPAESIVLPRGTAVEGWIRSRYPQLSVIITETEAEAFDMVSSRKADMTMRSLAVAAYAIRKRGLFNLKIAGQMPEYQNELRIGVLKTEPLLCEILGRAVRTISPKERGQVRERHPSIDVQTPVNYRLIIKVIAGLGALMIVGIVWNYRLRKLNARLEKALMEVRTLQGLLPICAWCKKVRSDEGLWTQIE